MAKEGPRGEGAGTLMALLAPCEPALGAVQPHCGSGIISGATTQIRSIASVSDRERPDQGTEKSLRSAAEQGVGLQKGYEAPYLSFLR